MFITRGVLKGDGYRIGGGISPIYRSHRGNVESIESDSASNVTHIPGPFRGAGGGGGVLLVNLVLLQTKAQARQR